MVLPILNKVKQLWNTWDLRVLILLSLLLQALLILFASLRKRTGSKWVIFPIWSAYLFADWVATFALGLISRSVAATCGPRENGDLLAFWAPFLLLHLGGPDSITSFSIADNELWLRHLLGLFLQVLAAAYVFFQSLPKNKLWLPTILMFIAGTIKYAERTFALYSASLDHIGGSLLPKPDPGSEYEKIAQRYSSMKKANLPTLVETIPEPDKKFWGSKYADNESGESDERSLLRTAYDIFENYKGLIVGQLFSPRERENSRDFFLKRTAIDAFRLIEFELSFMYEVLHTKVAVVRCRSGYSLRIISFSSVLLAGFLFFFLAEKHGFRKFDKSLTFALLIGAMVLDTLSFIKLIFSDWTVVSLKNGWGKYIPAIFLRKRRWSGSVSRCNLLNYCLEYSSKRLGKLLHFLGIGGYIDKVLMMRSWSQNVTDGLKQFIYNELWTKSLIADDVKTAEEMCSQRGAWALLRNSIYDDLGWSFDQFQYAESLLLWHIASELCYNDTTSDNSLEQNLKSPWTNLTGIGVWLAKFITSNLRRILTRPHSAHTHSTEKTSQHNDTTSDQEFCRLLSDYMFYLMVMQPKMMAPVAGNWQLVFQDTCAEAKRFFRRYSSSSDQRKACQRLLSVDTFFRSAPVKGGKSKSLLFDACTLAKQLQNLEQNRWELMSQVWVELMSYAAINCSPTIHAEQARSGGELLTFVWLLMTHLGLGKQFSQQVSLGKMKMVVGK